MAGDVETAASDVILPAQESATSMAVKHGGKYCKCTCDYEYVRTGLKKKIIILANISLSNLDPIWCKVG